MNVAGILSTKGTEVATVAPEALVTEVLATLRRAGVGALVVSPDGRTIAGLVSERDIVRYLAELGAGGLVHAVRELMTADVRTCTPADTAEGLMSLMTELRIRHVPVVDADGRLAGMISIGDVVKSRVEELEQDQAQLIEYVRAGQ